MVMGVFVISLIGFIVGLLIGVPILMLVAKIFKQSKVFIPSLKVVLIISALGFIISLFSFGNVLTVILFILMVVFETFLIKKFFNTGLGTAIGILVVWAIFTGILVVLLVAILWTVIVSVVSPGFTEFAQIIPLL